MTERDTKGVDLSGRVEFFVRRIFERIGGAIDFALRRGSGLEGGARTDVATLAPLIEQAIEANLKRENSRVFAPNLIELRYDYETYTRMGAPRREFLQRELHASIYEYIYNRRYASLGELQIRILYDAFTRGLEIKADFGEPKPAVLPQNAPENATAAANQVGPAPVWPDRADNPAAKRRSVALRIEGNPREIRAQLASDAAPVGIGRNSANDMIIDDATVSNFHAALTLSSDGEIFLADRGSSNGVQINGVPLETGDRLIVRDGDRLRFGDVEVVLKVSPNAVDK
jgi:hypothetical protein